MKTWEKFSSLDERRGRIVSTEEEEEEEEKQEIKGRACACVRLVDRGKNWSRRVQEGNRSWPDKS